MKSINEFFNESLVNESIGEYTMVNQGDSTAIVMSKKMFQDWKSGSILLLTWADENTDYEALGVSPAGVQGDWCFITSEAIKNSGVNSKSFEALKYSRRMGSMEASEPTYIPGTDLVLVLIVQD